MTDNRPDDPPAAEVPLWGDQEMIAASGVPLPSLRVLQSAGAIRAQKAPRYHGGFRRMWTGLEWAADRREAGAGDPGGGTRNAGGS